jgi:predicted nucleotidyltransferase
MSAKIAIDRQRLAEFCRRHHIRRLALFGSILRDDFGPHSDVDILVEFDPGHVPGFGMVDLEDELSSLVGRKVDLHTTGSLSKYFRDRVVREAQDQYVRA